MSATKQHLQRRIAELTKAHSALKQQESKETNETMALGCNSQAAGIWDTKCELERALEVYNAEHPEPAIEVNEYADDNHATPDHLKI